MMDFKCPHCQQPFRVSDENVGQTVACPHCSGSITIPTSVGVAPPALPAGGQLGPAPGRSARSSKATCGIVAVIMVALGVFVLAAVGILAAILLPSVTGARESARRASCQNNMKQMGLVFKMFANESHGEYFPALSPEPGRLMCANSTPSLTTPVYPEYLTDGHVLLCPSDSDAGWDDSLMVPEVFLNDESYFYLGYVITNDDEMEAFAVAYKQAIEEGRGFDEDLPAPPSRGSGGGDTFLRLQERIERKLMDSGGGSASIAMMQAEIPIFLDRLGNHVPPGGNVLFMDGHVEFLRYPGQWPMTEKTVRILEELDSLGP